MKNIRKIHFAAKDKDVFLPIYMAEALLSSVFEDLTNKSKFTKKWDQFVVELADPVIKINELVNFLSYCSKTSVAMKKNEFTRDVKVITLLTKLIQHHSEIAGLDDSLEKIWNNK